jgi:hypothetical protein
MSEIKLYYFNPNTYSTQWFVAAHSREEAITAVEAHIRAEVAAERFYDDDKDDFGPNNSEDFRDADQKREERLQDQLRYLAYYVRATPWPHSPRDPAPCIEEHPIGKVIETAIS